MTPAYLGHFDLDRVPFSKEIADADLWMPPSKEALVHELCEALHERGSVVLTGDPGAGKSFNGSGIIHQSIYDFGRLLIDFIMMI
ncbi:MAG TPA: hypothetical protein PLD96_04835 [Methanothrix sp.]|nr:hypothetical protein [Methanothrix sp.]